MQARRPREADRAAATIPVASAEADESAIVGMWWAVALRGALNVLFGVLALVWPDVTFVALVLLFGAYAFVDGIFALVAAFSRSRRRAARRERGLLVLEGILGIGAGLVTVFYPGITAVALLVVIAAWAIVGGTFEIVQAVRLRKQIRGEWLLGLAGALSVAFGVLVLLYPAAGALSIVWLLGAYAIAFGAVLIALGIRLRRFGRDQAERAATPTPASA
jgi:uncharacterized membrane protein HdeD (DUF308 family)